MNNVDLESFCPGGKSTMFISDADVMAGPEGSQAFFDALGAQDKTLDFWPGLYHEILNEPESEEVISRYVNWLESHL